jgi:hypothetical protein
VSCGTLANWLAGADEPVVVFALGLAACIGWMQAALWTPFRSPSLKLLILFAGALLPGMSGAWLYNSSGLPEYAMVAVLGCLLALSYPAALAGVARDRRGDAWPSGLSTSWRLWQNRRPPALFPERFGSPVRALHWYMRGSPQNTVGRFLLTPLVVILPTLLCSIPHMLAPSLHPYALFLLFTFVSMLYCVALPAFVNLPPAKGAKPVRPHQALAFVLLRPIGSGRLAVAFLDTTLRVVLWNWAVWLPLGLLACLCWSAFSDMPAAILREAISAEIRLFFGRVSAWQTAGVATLSAIAIVGGTWRILTDLLLVGLVTPPERRVYFGVAMALAALNAFVAVGIPLLFNPTRRAVAVDTLVGVGLVILAVKVVVAAVVFRFAYGRGLLEGISLRTFFLTWFIVAAALLGATGVIFQGLGLPVPTGLVLLWGAILLPLGRFALLPLVLEDLRHR